MGFWLARPTDEELRERLERQDARSFSYAPVGATRDPGRLVADGIPPPYRLDHYRTRIGTGEECFTRACEALSRWAATRVGVLQLCWPDAPLDTGTSIGILTRWAGLWSFHACRVVYREHEAGEVETLAFAWGTLPEHALCGEERFAVEYHRGNGTVWYDLLVVSRPRHPLAWLAYPLVRLLQRRFGRESLSALRRAARPPASPEVRSH